MIKNTLFLALILNVGTLGAEQKIFLRSHGVLNSAFSRAHERGKTARYSPLEWGGMGALTGAAMGWGAIVGANCYVPSKTLPTRKWPLAVGGGALIGGSAMALIGWYTAKQK